MSPTDGVRPRAVVYATTADARHRSIVVFEHRDHPDAGIQVPAGGIDVNETPERAARRELQEETGIRACSVTLLGRATDMHPNGYRCDNWYFRAEVAHTLARWSHTVSDGDEDLGLVFECWFMPIREARGRLHRSQVTFLDAL